MFPNTLHESPTLEAPLSLALCHLTSPNRRMAQVLQQTISWALCPGPRRVQLAVPFESLNRIWLSTPEVEDFQQLHKSSLMKPPEVPAEWQWLGSSAVGKNALADSLAQSGHFPDPPHCDRRLHQPSWAQESTACPGNSQEGAGDMKREQEGFLCIVLKRATCKLDAKYQANMAL